MAARHIGDVHQPNEVNVFPELGDQVTLGDLFVKEIVEKLNVGIADGTHNFKTLGGGSQKVFWIFFRVNVFHQKLDAILSRDISCALQSVDAIRAHGLTRKAGNRVSRLKNKARAFEFLHRGDEFAKVLQERVAVARVGQGVPDTGGSVKLDGQLLLFAAGSGEIEPGLCVVALLITALNVGLTGQCYRGAVAEIGRMRTADIG